MNQTKNQKFQRLKTIKILAAGGLLALAVWSGAAAADTPVQGYDSSQTIQPGLVVALAKKSTKSVIPAPASDASQMYGVAIDPADAPLTLNGPDSKVFVATSGSYKVLVSTIYGPIKSGDLLSISNTDGIAAKATKNQSTVLGRAGSDFDGRAGTITNTGKAAIGRISVQISIKDNPIAENSVLVPNFLRKASNSVAGKAVSEVRIYAALGVFVFTAIIAVLVLWSGVRGSLIALGRNPLSRHTIFRGMYKVIFTGSGIFILGLAGVYLLLKI